MAHLYNDILTAPVPLVRDTTPLAAHSGAESLVRSQVDRANAVQSDLAKFREQELEKVERWLSTWRCFTADPAETLPGTDSQH